MQAEVVDLDYSWLPARGRLPNCTHRTGPALRFEAHSSGGSLASIHENILRSSLPTCSMAWFLSAS